MKQRIRRKKMARNIPAQMELQVKKNDKWLI